MPKHKYDIYDTNHNKVGEQEHEASFTCALLQGQTAVLVAIDGKPLTPESVGIVGSGTNPLDPDAEKPVSPFPVTVSDTAE